MNVKIDTKEKFHVITIRETTIAANMTDELENSLLDFLGQGIKNVVLNCKDIQTLEPAAASTLTNIQQLFYEKDASFVICELRPAVEDSLDREGLLELLNTAPTESEAMDIVHMEEIERELMDGEDTE